MPSTDEFTQALLLRPHADQCRRAHLRPERRDAAQRPDLAFEPRRAVEQPLAAGTGFLRADWSYSSEQNVDTALDPRAEQGSYSLLSARLGWRNDRYSVSVWATT